MKITIKALKVLLVIIFSFALISCSSTSKSILNEKSIDMYVGQSFNPKEYLESKYASEEEVTIENSVDTKTVGTYQVNYSYKGKIESLSVIVNPDPITLTAESVNLDIGLAFSPKDYISAEDLGNDIKIVNNVNSELAGEYIVIYSFAGLDKTLKVIINSVDFNLSKQKLSIKQGEQFDPKDYLVEENKSNTKIEIKNNVDTNKPGEYTVTYTLYSVIRTLGVTVTSVSAPATPTTTTKPTTPTTSTTYKLSVLSITSPIDTGSEATLEVQGKAGKEYSITVYYKSGPSAANGLESKEADSDGIVSWTWKVGTRTTAGSWKIVVTGDGKTLTTYFTVN